MPAPFPKTDAATATAEREARFRPQVIRSWMPLRRIRWRCTLWIARLLRHLLGSRSSERVGILMYHRVSPITFPGPPPTWNVTPTEFRSQLQGLLKLGYRPIALENLVEQHDHKSSMPARAFVVTFDDGYANNYWHAFPVLRELGVPATLFLATAYVDETNPFPFDDWEMAGDPRVSDDSWRVLTSAQIKEMRDSGLVALGCHTDTHEDFRGQPEAFHEDVRRSVRTLREVWGVERPSFAYPFGAADTSLAKVIREMDFPCALGTSAVPIDPRSDTHAWGRIEATSRDSATDLAAKLDGWYQAVDGIWKRIIRGGETLAILDQAILSLVGLATAFLIGRASPIELANYYLAFRLLWLARTTQHHLICLPLKIQTQQFSEQERPGYFAAVRAQQVLLMAACAALVPWIPKLFGWDDAGSAAGWLWPFLGIAVPLYLAREFVRQLSFALFRPGRALLVDTLTSAAQLLGMTWLAASGRLTASATYALIAFASLVGMGEWIVAEGSRRGTWAFPRFREACRWHWRFGRWNLATDLLSSATYLGLVAILRARCGVEETGTLAAAMLPVGVVLAFMQGWLNVLMPRATRALMTDGPLALRGELRRLGLTMAGLAGGLIVATWIGGEDIFRRIYGEGYPGVGGVAIAALVSTCIGSLGYAAGTGLILSERARINLWTEILQSCVSIPLAMSLTPRFGAMSVPLATSGAVAIGGLVRWGFWRAWFMAHVGAASVREAGTIAAPRPEPPA